MSASPHVKDAAFRIVGSSNKSFSTAEWAFNELWHQIVLRTLAPGQKVTEETLSELLQISRTPLREAIRRLVSVGLITKHRNRTLTISLLSVEEAEELTLIREQLEALVAFKAAQNSSQHPVQVAEAWLLIYEMKVMRESPHSTTALLALGDKFHAKLFDISGAERIRNILSQVYLGIERYRLLLNENQDRAYGIVSEHEAIMSAIEKGDGNAAEQAMRHHISKARLLYIEELQRIL
jgi:DNA-binding GntR family transcriptional regulator